MNKSRCLDYNRQVASERRAANLGGEFKGERPSDSDVFLVKVTSCRVPVERTFEARRMCC